MTSPTIVTLDGVQWIQDRSGDWRHAEDFRMVARGLAATALARIAVLEAEKLAIAGEPSAERNGVDQTINEGAAMPRSPIMQFFAYAHLPEHLQVISRPFGELAEHLEATLPSNAEKSTALRKLLESKDCAVRAMLPEAPSA